MEILKDFIKSNGISYDYLSEETGYSKVYLSQALNGHMKPSIKFDKLLQMALEKYKNKQINNFKEDFPYDTKE